MGEKGQGDNLPAVTVMSVNVFQPFMATTHPFSLFLQLGRVSHLRLCCAGTRAVVWGLIL
jgi:hypothetical protein